MRSSSPFVVRHRTGILVTVVFGLALALLYALPPRASSAEGRDSARGGPESSREARVEEALPPPELSPAFARIPARGDAGPSPADLAARVFGELGCISGTVLGPDGEPIFGARCSVIPGSSSWGFVTGPPATDLVHGSADLAARAARDESAEDGRFRIPVPAGYWRLTVEAEGFARWSEDHLRPGDQREVALGFAGALLVTVRDTDGTPVAGADARVVDAFREIESPALAEGRTDAGGAVLLEGLPAGERYLTVRHPEYQVVHEPVSITNERRAFELVLSAGVRLSGRVRADSAATGKGPPDAALRIAAYSKGQSLIVRETCAADGSFSTAAIFSPGEALAISAGAPGFAESYRTIVVPPDAEGEESVEILLRSAARRVIGRAVDASGRPLAGVSVFSTTISSVSRGQDGLTLALAEVTPHPERWIARPATDQAGVFELDGLATGVQYLVLLVHDELSPVVEWVPDSEPGTELDLGDLRMVACGSLWGFANAADGRALSGARIRAQMEIFVSGSESVFDSWRPTSWWRPLEVVTGAQGFFRFDQLAPGSYEVFLKGTLLGNWYVGSGDTLGPVEIVARDADQPETTATWEGTVVDEAGGPVPGAFVGMFAAGESLASDEDDRSVVAMTFTDYRGRFKMDADEGVKYLLRVSDMRGRFFAHEERVEWREDPLGVILVAAPGPGEPLIGMVLGPDGTPLAGVDVALVPPENEYCGCVSFLAKTDDNGMVQFDQLANEDHSVVVTDPHGRFASETTEHARPGGYFEVILGD